MGDYGFVMQVNDLTSAKMKQIEQSVKQLGGTVKTTTAEMNDNFNQLGESARNMGRMIAEAFTAYEIFNFGKELMHTAAEFQGFENVIKYSSEGIVDNARNMDYLRDSIDRLHLPMKETFESFSEMQAGFYGTGIEGDKLRKVFEGVAEASSVLHLNPETFSRVTFALKEIGELGTVQMRQMRMLAFSLPGAMNIAAKSMGMNSAEFHEAMKKGQIQSSVFLPKFAEALTQHFSPGLGNAGQSLISQINDQKNAVLKLMLDMGETLTPFFSHVLKAVGDGMKMIKSVWDSLNSNNKFVQSLIEVFDIVAKLVPIWIAYKAVMIANSLITSVFAVENGILTASIGSLTVMTDGSTVAFEGLSAAIATTGIGALVVGIGLLIEKLISMNSELDQAIDKKYKLSESKNDFKSIGDMAQSIKERYSVFNQLDKGDRQKLAADVGEFLNSTRSKIPVFNERAKALNTDASKPFGKETGVSAFLGANLLKSLTDSTYRTGLRVNEQTKEFNSNLKGLGSNFVAIKEIGNQLKQKGFKPSLYSSTTETNPGKDQAVNTSQLAGAAGGLGSAKIIQIHIDTVQKNIGVKETKSMADEAVEQIIRQINNLSDSQSSM